MRSWKRRSGGSRLGVGGAGDGGGKDAKQGSISGDGGIADDDPCLTEELDGLARRQIVASLEILKAMLVFGAGEASLLPRNHHLRPERLSNGCLSILSEGSVEHTLARASTTWLLGECMKSGEHR